MYNLLNTQIYVCVCVYYDIAVTIMVGKNKCRLKIDGFNRNYTSHTAFSLTLKVLNLSVDGIVVVCFAADRPQGGISFQFSFF